MDKIDTEKKNQKSYWKSLDGTQDTGEFKSSPLKEKTSDADRRHFLKVMGAGLAMMGASACTRKPQEKIVPYVNKPEEVTPGVANWYASSCSECSSSCGTLVKTREGRPIKLEGNEDHPISKGGLCARGQSSVLDLYDPDRLKTPLQPSRKGQATGTTWEQLDTKVVEKLKEIKAKGGSVRVLSGELSSPSTERLISDFLKGFRSGRHVTYEVLGNEEVAMASELSYGKRAVPRYKFDKAEYVVSFGADFLGTWGNSVANNKGYSKNRKIRSKNMSRHVAFESLLTMSGMNADSRYRVRTGDEARAALALAHELIVSKKRSRFASDAQITKILKKYPATTIGSDLKIDPSVFTKLATQLWANRGKSIIVGGGQSVKGDVGVALESIVNLLNSALENEGKTVDATGSPQNERSSFEDLTKLISEMKTGQVDALLIVGTNPVYSLPKSLGFQEAMGNVGTILNFSTHLDETARISDFVCATHHALENWGDSSSVRGVFAIRQPTIAPLYKTRSFEDSLMNWAKRVGLSGNLSSQPNWYSYLKNNWKSSVHGKYGVGTPFLIFWDNLLRKGVFDRSAKTARARSLKSGVLSWTERFLPAKATGEMRLVLYPKVSMYDGRGANNSWLQELPDPVSKVTWDNYAAISAGTAKALGVKTGGIVKVSSGSESVELPVNIQPGMADSTVAVALGYGRVHGGRVGTGIGKNGFPLAVMGKRALQFSALKAGVEKTGKTYKLATTQNHHTMMGRPIVKEASLSEYRSDPKAGNHGHFKKGKIPTLWPKYKYTGYKWSMAIDLNSCTGCSACLVACQAENNIPVVGKEFVLDGREMHWIRLDRYYTGDKENPDTVMQPMLCAQCDNAPCETVCPVLATMHDEEGLNQQVYNRCVGTRYCANNCPYKVRRFNWFTFTELTKPLNLQFNPDVTVRTRGIMEKCTFCVQRIQTGKDIAKDEKRKVKDGEIKTACQQSCPADAITFGDINDPESKVAKMSKDDRGYHLLEELNILPSITYLTKIRNKEV